MRERRGVASCRCNEKSSNVIKVQRSLLNAEPLSSKPADTSIPDSFSYDLITAIFAAFCEISFSFRTKAKRGRFADPHAANERSDTGWKPMLHYSAAA
jgi:hypothetical protein